VLLCCTLLPGQASAERLKAFDQYEVHYNAFNTTFLTPEVAKTYSIQRSKVRGLINIAVLDSANQDTPVTALVSGQIRNLVGQTQDLTFKLIREGVAVYYIAEFRYTNDEILNFNLQVQPDPNKAAYQVEFKQHFYVD
jgi:hypothetical protein